MPEACSIPSYAEFSGGGGASLAGGAAVAGAENVAGDAGSPAQGGDAGSALGGDASVSGGDSGGNANGGTSGGSPVGGSPAGGTGGEVAGSGGTGGAVAGAPGGSAGAAPVTPTLSVVFASASNTLDLTAEGTLDWVHWGYPDTLGIARKAGVLNPLIGGLSGVNAPVLHDYSNGTTFSWTDGNAPYVAEQTQNYLYINKPDSGIDLPIAADTTLRTLRVYVDVFSGDGTLNVSLSDASVAPYSKTLTAPQDVSLRDKVKIVYSAGKPGQTLHFNWVLSDAGTGSSGGNITLAAATLQ